MVAVDGGGCYIWAYGGYFSDLSGRAISVRFAGGYAGIKENTILQPDILSQREQTSRKDYVGLSPKINLC